MFPVLEFDIGGLLPDIGRLFRFGRRRQADPPGTPGTPDAEPVRSRQSSEESTAPYPPGLLERYDALYELLQERERNRFHGADTTPPADDREESSDDGEDYGTLPEEFEAAIARAHDPLDMRRVLRALNPRVRRLFKTPLARMLAEYVDPLKHTPEPITTLAAMWDHGRGFRGNVRLMVREGCGDNERRHGEYGWMIPLLHDLATLRGAQKDMRRENVLALIIADNDHSAEKISRELYDRLGGLGTGDAAVVADHWRMTTPEHWRRKDFEDVKPNIVVCTPETVGSYMSWSRRWSGTRLRWMIVNAIDQLDWTRVRQFNDVALKLWKKGTKVEYKGFFVYRKESSRDSENSLPRLAYPRLLGCTEECQDIGFEVEGLLNISPDVFT